jgi:hypothetical protein
MRLRLTIAFHDTSQPEPLDQALVHRLRNFGEDLHREFSITEYAKISFQEIDSATRELRVFVNTKRHLGAVSAYINKSLERHNLDKQFTVSRG